MAGAMESSLQLGLASGTPRQAQALQPHSVLSWQLNQQQQIQIVISKGTRSTISEHSAAAGSGGSSRKRRQQQEAAAAAGSGGSQESEKQPAPTRVTTRAAGSNKGLKLVWHNYVESVVEGVESTLLLPVYLAPHSLAVLDVASRSFGPTR